MVAKPNRLLLEYTSSFFDEDRRTFVEDVAKLELRNGSEVTFDFFLVGYLQPRGSRLTVPLGTLSRSSWSIAALYK